MTPEQAREMVDRWIREKADDGEFTVELEPEHSTWLVKRAFGVRGWEAASGGNDGKVLRVAPKPAT